MLLLTWLETYRKQHKPIKTDLDQQFGKHISWLRVIYQSIYSQGEDDILCQGRVDKYRARAVLTG